MRMLAIAALNAAALAIAGPAFADDRADWPSSLTVGTASQGGTYFIYGAGWAGLVQEELGIATSTEATGGPVQNMALVQAGDLDFGMVTMGPAYDGWIGESEIAPGVEMQDVRALFPMYETPFQIIALQRSGIRSMVGTVSRVAATVCCSAGFRVTSYAGMVSSKLRDLRRARTRSRRDSADWISLSARTSCALSMPRN